ncbi:hypothetical protein CEP51_012941 [Fusarium floridanum]|uniref:Uncharacterized protein n=1 Tax=Fusarium floridanum TaxID=1325733 RepID=A0A428QKG6_9HYPO|nr:hypothetical protein CEP51_012941 [Fusarium floridanum]
MAARHFLASMEMLHQYLSYDRGTDEQSVKLPADQYLELAVTSLASINFISPISTLNNINNINNNVSTLLLGLDRHLFQSTFGDDALAMLTTVMECIRFRETATEWRKLAIEFPERCFQSLQKVGAIKRPTGLSSGGFIHTHLTLGWLQALSDMFYLASVKYPQSRSDHTDDPNQEMSLYVTEFRKKLANCVVEFLQISQGMAKLQRRRYIDLELVNVQRLSELCTCGLYDANSGAEFARTTLEFLKLCDPEDSAFLQAKLQNQWSALPCSILI